jgi:hypothetical protein
VRLDLGLEQVESNIQRLRRTTADDVVSQRG